MKPWKPADYFSKVSFHIVVDMKQGESKPFPDFNLVFLLLLFSKNIFIMKNLTDFRKSMETGVDPCLR